MDKMFIGKQGEDLTCAYLVENGYQIIERNFRKPWGELDVVAQYKDGTLVFVEVKTLRQSSAQAIKNDSSQGLQPEDQLTRDKLLKTQRAAALYASRNPKIVNEEKGWRIDLLCLTLPNKLTNDLKDCKVKHYENI